MRLLRPALLCAAAALLGPAPARAADLTPLYPDDTEVAVCVRVKDLLGSPLGKKMLGTGRTFDVARSLIRMIDPDAPPLRNYADPDVATPVAALVNGVHQVTIAGRAGDKGGGDDGVAIFLEGALDNTVVTRGIRAICEAENLKFKTEKIGDYTVLVAGSGRQAAYIATLGKGTVALVPSRDGIEEVLDKHAGDRKTKLSKTFQIGVKAADTEDVAIWAVATTNFGSEDVKLTRVIGKVTVGADVDVTVQITCETEADAKGLRTMLDAAKDDAIDDIPSDFVRTLLKKADITVQQSGRSVTVTGTLSGRLLADEFRKLKDR